MRANIYIGNCKYLVLTILRRKVERTTKRYVHRKVQGTVKRTVQRQV